MWMLNSVLRSTGCGDSTMSFKRGTLRLDGYLMRGFAEVGEEDDKDAQEALKDVLR